MHIWLAPSECDPFQTLPVNECDTYLKIDRSADTLPIQYGLEHLHFSPPVAASMSMLCKSISDCRQDTLPGVTEAGVQKAAMCVSKDAVCE